MKRLMAAIVVLGMSGVALAQPPPEPPVPLAKKTYDERGRKHPFAPIPFFYRETDNQRVNVGNRGRVNSAGGELRQAMTPSWQEPALVNY
jgi:hypothetical protein